jgi:hypothetical protein
MDPITEFLSEYGEKRAGFAGAALRSFPEQLAMGAATAGAAALVVGAGMGAKSLYDAVTKAHDFRKMLSFNEDLAAHHAENPKYINAAFSTLRRINPEFSKDPLVAGAFVRQMVATPEAAFGLAGQAAGFAPRPGPVETAVVRSIEKGVSPHMTLAHQAELDRMHHIFRLQAQPQALPTPRSPAGRPLARGAEPSQESVDSVIARLRKVTGE